jgi:DnaJ-class molecular chaperone
MDGLKDNATASSTVPCPECNGKGEQIVGDAPNERALSCETCEGTGRLGPDSLSYEWALGYWQERDQ